MECRYPISEMDNWAKAYGDPAEDAQAEAIGAAARDRGLLTLDDLVVLAEWKSVRIRPRIARNDDAFVREVTRAALSAAPSAAGERLRIEVLTLLEGVGWPMASVILHFCHRDPYPILDVRALWSLGIPEGEPKSGYDFAFWLRYVEACRTLAAESGKPMRVVDRALWGYSKRQQNPPTETPR